MSGADSIREALDHVAVPCVCRENEEGFRVTASMCKAHGDNPMRDRAFEALDALVGEAAAKDEIISHAVTELCLLAEELQTKHPEIADRIWDLTNERLEIPSRMAAVSPAQPAEESDRWLGGIRFRGKRGASSGGEK